MSEDKSFTTINASRILKRNICSETKNDEEKITSLLQLSHIRLDREQIKKVDNLECLGSVTNLYLQQNCIEVIENLECLSNSLQFLTLAGNKIKKVQGLLCLNLKLLDLSDNQIDILELNELPQSLLFVSLKNNKCTSISNYREGIMERLPNVKSIDDVFVDQDSSDDESEEESEEGEKEIEEVCLDILEHSSVRLEEIAELHKKRLREIEAKKYQIEQSNTGISTLSRDELHDFQDNINNFLQTMISIERGVMKEDTFNLPIHKCNNEKDLESVTDVDSFTTRPTPTPPVGPRMSEPCISNSNDQFGKQPSQQTKYVSVGTSTSQTEMLSNQNIKRPTSKTLLRKQGTTKPQTIMSSNKIKSCSYKSKYSNVSSKIDARLTTPNSLMRIPGARPFHKQ